MIWGIEKNVLRVEGSRVDWFGITQRLRKTIPELRNIQKSSAPHLRTLQEWIAFV